MIIDFSIQLMFGAEPVVYKLRPNLVGIPFTLGIACCNILNSAETAKGITTQQSLERGRLILQIRNAITPIPLTDIQTGWIKEGINKEYSPEYVVQIINLLEGRDQFATNE